MHCLKIEPYLPYKSEPYKSELNKKWTVYFTNEPNKKWTYKIWILKMNV